MKQAVLVERDRWTRSESFRWCRVSRHGRDPSWGQLVGQRQERLERFRLDGLAFDCGNAGDPTPAYSSDGGSEAGASWRPKCPTDRAYCLSTR